MHIKPGFILKEVAGEYMAIPFGQEYGQAGAVIALNATGAFLWDCMEEPCGREELCAALMDQYSIERGLAEEAVDEFLAALRDGGLLEEA